MSSVLKSIKPAPVARVSLALILEQVGEGTHQAQLERPHATRPQLNLVALRQLDLQTVPPALPRRFAPEEKQLLGSCHLMIVHIYGSFTIGWVVGDTGLEEDKCYR